MARIADAEAQLLDGAHRLALARSKMPPRVSAAEEFVRQFLIREILAMYRHGETDMQALANLAVGRLREHLQVRQSAKRLSGRPVRNWPTVPQPLNAWTPPARCLQMRATNTSRPERRL
jgi:hypothetical protein